MARNVTFTESSLVSEASSCSSCAESTCEWFPHRRWCYCMHADDSGSLTVSSRRVPHSRLRVLYFTQSVRLTTQTPPSFSSSRSD
jgi:hypothetical protein